MSGTTVDGTCDGRRRSRPEDLRAERAQRVSLGSTTSRPRYSPQERQARCGSLISPQLGQEERAGSLKASWARRRSRRALEWRRLGFGIVDSPIVKVVLGFPGLGSSRLLGPSFPVQVSSPSQRRNSRFVFRNAFGQSAFGKCLASKPSITTITPKHCGIELGFGAEPRVASSLSRRNSRFGSVGLWVCGRVCGRVCGLSC